MNGDRGGPGGLCGGSGKSGGAGGGAIGDGGIGGKGKGGGDSGGQTQCTQHSPGQLSERGVGGLPQERQPAKRQAEPDTPAACGCAR
jgi:hypothetical protein